MLVTVDDLVVEAPSPAVLSSIRSVMNYRVSNTSHYADQEAYSSLSDHVLVTSTGANPIKLLKVHARGTEDIRSAEEAENTARWIISSHAHADYITKNPQLFLPLFNATTNHVDVKYKGIASRWALTDVQDWVSFSLSSVTAKLNEIATYISTSYDGRVLYAFNEPKLSRTFHGDYKAPTLQRAYYAARRATLVDLYNNMIRVTDGDMDRLTVAVKVNSDKSVGWGAFRGVDTILKLYHTRPSQDNIQMHRATVLSEQSRVQANEQTVRRQLAQANFYTYWDTMKAQVRAVVPSESVSAEQFRTIPLQPQGTESSRTWGIEVETVQAELTSRPAGWRSEYDGSLSGSSGSSCNCSCDDCDDSNHCDDSDYDCYYNSSEGESREFVSPILSSFNSDGLLKLCTDLPDDEDNTTPGIHVHVGALDLTVTDVARLLTSYSAIEPLLVPLYHRQEFGYCKEMEPANIQWWLGAARKFMQDTGNIPAPKDICHSQPADRYRDVNLQALDKHGTVEFRSMGPHYNYDHLVRWAWVCRELVNVSKLGLPMNTWTRCRSILDVIAVLRKYGTEAPQDKLFDNINTAELALSLDEQ